MAEHLDILNAPARLEALHELDLLDTEAEPAFDRLTRLAARLVHAPVALFTLVDVDRQYFKSQIGLDDYWARERETPLSHSFCQYVVSSGTPLIVSDARQVPFLQNNRAITDLNIIAYAGTPLQAADGQTIGAFCVIDSRPRVWTDEELEILQEISASVVAEIELRRSLKTKQELLNRLSDSEARYRAIFDNSLDAIIVASTGGIYVMANPAACAMFGYSEAELKAGGWQLIVDRSDPRVESNRAQRQRSGYLKGNVRMRRADGKLLEIEMALAMYHTGQDDRQSVIILRDVTEKKRAEAALLDSEARYRSVIGALDEGIIVQSVEGVIVTTNPSAERILGLTQAQIEGRTALDPRWRAIREDGSMIPVEALPGTLTGKTGVPQTNVMLGFANADNQRVWVSVNAQPIILPGSKMPNAVVMSFTDVTARVAFETALKQYIAQLDRLRKIDAELAATLDIEQTLAISLDRAIRLSEADSGYIALMEPDGLRIKTHVGPYPVQAHTEPSCVNEGIVSRVLGNNQAELITDVHADPDYIAALPTTIAQMIFPLVAHDQIIGVIVVETGGQQRFTPEIFRLLSLLVTRIAIAIDNASLYKSLHERLTELMQLYAKVNGLEQTKSDMIRLASHDLKNPLSVAEGYLELVKEVLFQEKPADPQFSEAQEYIGYIEHSHQRMLQIIDNFLSLERIDSASTREAIDMRELVNDVIADTTPQAYARQLVVESHLPPEPLGIMGHKAQLYEAAVNLVSNAIKYTPPGGRLTIDLYKDDAAAVFTVQDTGYGVPADMQDQLFKPFYRAKTQEISGTEGTGLGLSLVKRIVERHSGQIIFHSVYGEGSLFGFKLPLT